MKKLLVLDGNGLIFRAFFATMTRMSYANNNTPTNAIYLFSSILMRLLEKKEFDDILVALDAPGKKFRHQEYKDYKANRKEVPAELKAQFAPIREFLNICNIKTLVIEGYEADDVIGTLSKHAKEYDLDMNIITGDRDLLQLIDDQVTVTMMHKGLSEVEAFDKAHLMEVYGIEPYQIIEVKSLMGDTADNIPGVKGIGEKTAFDLIKKYQSLDSIYENIEEVKGKMKEKLTDGKDMAYLSHELATIATDVPLDFSVLNGTYQGYDKVGLNKFFKLYNIKSLLKYTEEEKEKEIVSLKANLVSKVSKELLTDGSFIYLDCDNENYHYGDLKGLAIANGDNHEYITADMMMFDFDLIDYLENNDVKKSIFDSKESYVLLHKRNIELKGIDFDFTLASYLVNPDIKDTLQIFSNFDIVIAPLSKTSTLEEKSLYAETIAFYADKIKGKLLEKINEIDNLDLLYKVEQPLAIILAKMEINGVLVDVELLNRLDEEYSNALSDIEGKIYQIVGHEVNINSPKQLAELLYDELKLPCNKKRSTTADDLNYIASMHEVVPLILEYRKYSKLLNTYIDAFNAFRFKDGRIHAMFNQASTMTGRLSSSQPNLQNLSVRDDDRKIIRKLVVAPKGFKILSLDYSQIELRVLAILADDENLLEAFANGNDIHAATAAKINSISIDEVTPQMRRIAKATNFGIVYGISPWGLSEQINVSLEESKNLINKFYETYPKIKEYLDGQIKFCEENGYVTTILKRRRVVNEIKSSNYNLREFGKRVAMNTPIQGSAADLMKIAMIKVYECIDKYKSDCKLICQIHDELLFEVKDEIVDEVTENVKNIMENVLKDAKIKLKVSYAYGENWLEAK